MEWKGGLVGKSEEDAEEGEGRGPGKSAGSIGWEKWIVPVKRKREALEVPGAPAQAYPKVKSTLHLTTYCPPTSPPSPPPTP